MLIGLTAKNAILIVEFAILENKNNKRDSSKLPSKGPVFDYVYSDDIFAFILGCVPLWTAKALAAIGRRSWKVLSHWNDCSDHPGRLSRARPVWWLSRIAGKRKKEAVGIPRTAALEGGHDDAKNHRVALLPSSSRAARWPKYAPSNPAPPAFTPSAGNGEFRRRLAWWDCLRIPFSGSHSRSAESNYDLQLGWRRSRRKEPSLRSVVRSITRKWDTTAAFRAAIAFKFPITRTTLQLSAPLGD